MPTVVAVKLRFNPKTLWFSANEAQPVEGDHVIVETERGIEMGLATSGPFEVTEEELRAPLKPVVRVATEEDLRAVDSLSQREDDALPIFRELVKKYKLDMKPIDVEYLFGGDKAVFYFVSEERIDFRELVRELAARFRIRVDMRQIGVRDEARMVGGIGHCGQQLCCSRFGGDFQPVSIRMAKEQDLPLNPLKISGLCGRLMCCLRHEFDAYKDFKTRAPKKGAIIETALGLAKVSSLDTPREVINMRLESGKPLSIPLKSMECGKEGGCNCPCKVSRESMDELDDPQILLALSAMDRENEVDVVEERPAAEKPSRGSGGGGQGERRKRRPDQGGSKLESAPSEKVEGAEGAPKPAGKKSSRRGRGGRGGQGGGAQGGGQTTEAAAPKPKPEGAQPASSGGRKRRRRGGGGGGAAAGSAPSAE